MTRRFYKDPLEAAWMANRFGMRFQKLGYGECPWPYGMFHDFHLRLMTEQADDGIYHRDGLPRFYIHPDSLHLLSPQEGDEGVDGYGLQVVFEGDSWTRRHPVAASADREAEGQVVIDKRNGIAFMWPESEPA
jgi:hypothetical protein